MSARNLILGLALVTAATGMAHAYWLSGDLNCDGAVNNFDIPPFVLVLTSTPPDYPEYYAQYPDCDHTRADMNYDGAVNNLDISPFVQCLTGVCPACMVLVAAGESEMGDSFGEGGSDELPVHDVYLDAYYIDTYEVTDQQYADALNWAWDQGGLIHVVAGVVYQYGGMTYLYCATTTSASYSRIHWDGNTFTVTAGKEDHPMGYVSWYGAVAFSNWRSAMEGRTPCYDLATWTCHFGADGFRLPTEAEWEKAAGWDPDLEYHFRYGEHTDGCGTDCLDGHRANYWGSGDPYEAGDYPWTTPVGFYNGELHQKADFGWPSNPPTYQTQDAQSYYGCRDMSGNVCEWCHDWYDSGYYGSSPYDNPTGPASGGYRVLRGGFYYVNPGDCRPANRHYCPPGYRDAGLGFRCVAGTP